jgi:hypothetical protein
MQHSNNGWIFIPTVEVTMANDPAARHGGFEMLSK